ncbi:MAG: AEC family transporter [Peptococcaceae bacterium]|nr:AEC family transporter [Peptococcaceae bacterium]
MGDLSCVGADSVQKNALVHRPVFFINIFQKLKKKLIFLQSILLSLNVMLPVFLTILLGVFLQKIGILPRRMVRDLNRLCFKCLLPIMLFNNVRETDFRQHFEWHLIAYAVITVLLLFAFLLWLVPKLVEKPEQQSVVIQGIYRSNYVILGIPIVGNIYAGQSIATITMLIAIIVPMFNLLAVYLFERFNGQNRHDPLKLILGIAKNPLIIATALGMLYVAAGIQFPGFLDKTLNDLGAATIPIALLILGADLDLKLENTHVHYLTAAVLGKVLLVPLVFLPPAVLLGFRGQALASLLTMYASPAAISGYIMAQNENADHHLAGQIVVITSVVSCFTLFVFIAVLKEFNLI